MSSQKSKTLFNAELINRIQTLIDQYVFKIRMVNDSEELQSVQEHTLNQIRQVLEKGRDT